MATTGSEQRGAQQPVHAEQREGERPHGAQQHHVLAGHGHDVQQAAACGSRRSSAWSTPSSSPRTMPCSTSPTGECTPAAQMRARRQAQPVDRALEAAAAAGDREVGEVGLQQRRARRGGAGSGRSRRRRAAAPAAARRSRRAGASSGALRERSGRVEPKRLPLLEPQPQVGGLARASRPATPVTRTARVTWSSLAAGRSVSTAVSATRVAGVGGERGPGDGVEPGAAEHGAGADEEQGEAGGGHAGGARPPRAGARTRRHQRAGGQQPRPLPAARAAAATPSTRQQPGAVRAERARAEARADARRLLRR